MNYTQRILGKYYDIPAIRVIFEIAIIVGAAFAIRTFLFGLYQVPSGSMETTLLVGERFFADKLTYWFRKPRRGEIIAFNDPTYNYSSNPVVNLWQRYVSWNVSNWTKRVIGVPGDRIQGKIENGVPVVYLNGKKLDESGYINKYPIIYTFPDIPKSFDPEIKSWQEQPFYKINPQNLLLDPLGRPRILYPGTPNPYIDMFDFVLGENQYWAMGDNRLGSSDSRVWKILDGRLIHGKIIYRMVSIDSEDSWWIVDIIKNPLGFWKKIRWNRCLQWVS